MKMGLRNRRPMNQSTTERSQLHASDAWLGETQVGDSSTRPMTFTYPPGSTPLPRYTIRRGIGMGGFGEVYFAVSEAGKEVALKRIQRNLEVELRGVSHCLNLKHPNLVALYDICQDANDQSWVVMEYVAGLNLRQVLDESPDGLPIEEADRWFRAISAGVNHLHSAGLVHRDLKPGNVFDDLGVVKVGDYGLSKFISASHRGGHTESVGTFHYMAPEIGRGQYGREIDIYALGILLYELLTGQVPFDGESCHEIIVKHLTASPELGGVAEPYRSTIARCLEKDPGKRFASVPEMLESLDGKQRHAESSAAVSDPAPIMAEVIQDEEPLEAVLVPEPGRRSKPSSSTDDEPVARAIRQSWDDLNRWWSTLDRSPGSKVFLLLIAGFVLLINTHWLLPMLSMVAVIYVPYYVVRHMVLHSKQQPTYAEAQRIATAAGAPRQPVSKIQWRSYVRNDLRAKRSIYRVAELNTSWIAATFAAVGMAIVAGVIGLRSGPVDAWTIAPYGWMAVVVLLASLGILGLGKLWERDEGEGLPRRLVLAGLGAGVGMAAYGVNEFLMLPLDNGLERGINTTDLPQAFYQNGTPLASALMAHFAMLFALLRWWKPVDPLRRRRLSLWAVAVAVVAEWGVHQILPIPQPAGMMIAGGIAVAVQLSAPWINPRDAKRMISNRGKSTNPVADARSVA
ncbi:MAG: serine/threonine-protein kinase [Rubripirellula sp.]